MERKPPQEVLRILRREVGFGCPVPDCRNPYLTWHHFDPPWSQRQHHNPEGMIALCREHHDKADAGAFTVAQLRVLKSEWAESRVEVGGRFDWMRRELLAVVGGNFYLDTPVILEFRREKAIWFERDDEGHFLLNVRMLTTTGEPRTRIENNFWVLRGSPADVEAPPSGRRVRVRYDNGDEIAIEFFEVQGADDLVRRYASARPREWGVDFPITAVEVRSNAAGSNFWFGPDSAQLGGITMTGCFMRSVGVAVSIG